MATRGIPPTPRTFASFFRRTRSRFRLDEPNGAQNGRGWSGSVNEKSWTGWTSLPRIPFPSQETLASWQAFVRWIPQPSKHTIIFRVSPLLLVSTLVLLLYTYSSQPILDSVKYTAPETNDGSRLDDTIPVSSTPAINKIHAEHLKPIQYDPDDPDVRKALVLASFSKQKTAWTADVHKSWEIYRYVLDDPNPVNGLTVPRNQGREAMAYLTYIIDHYDALPNFVVFHHGHLRAWHQPEPTPLKVHALNLSALAHDHYVNLRCAHRPGCTEVSLIDVAHPDEEEERVQARMLPKFWNTLFGNESAWDLGPPPSRLAVPCCAQFAVTREAILSRPLAFWKSYRRPLERDLDEYKPIWGPMANSYFVGICYEKVWHMVFGKPQTYCPSEEYCRKVQFSDAVVCDRYTGNFEDAAGWEYIQCINQWQDD